MSVPSQPVRTSSRPSTPTRALPIAPIATSMAQTAIPTGQQSKSTPPQLAGSSATMSALQQSQSVLARPRRAVAVAEHKHWHLNPQADFRHARDAFNLARATVRRVRAFNPRERENHRHNIDVARAGRQGVDFLRPRRRKHTMNPSRSDINERLGEAHIDPTLDDRCFVPRTYRSTTFNVTNTTAQAADGLGFSVQCYYDSTTGTQNLRIVRGSPFSGTDTGVTFADYQTEADYLDRLFRTRRIKKISLNVIGLPQQIMPVNEDDPANNPDVDAGSVTLLPWAGKPGNAAYNDGLLSSLQPIDWDRRIEKHKFPLCDDRPRIRELCVRPMIAKIVAPGDPSHTTAPPIDFEYVPTPNVDTSTFLLEDEQLNSYGWILYWYHPDLAANPSGSVIFQVYWEVQFEWSGIRIPESLAEDSPDVARLPGAQIHVPTFKQSFQAVSPLQDPTVRQLYDDLTSQQAQVEEHVEQELQPIPEKKQIPQ